MNKSLAIALAASVAGLSSLGTSPAEARGGFRIGVGIPIFKTYDSGYGPQGYVGRKRDNDCCHHEKKVVKRQHHDDDDDKPRRKKQVVKAEPKYEPKYEKPAPKVVAKPVAPKVSPVVAAATECALEPTKAEKPALETAVLPAGSEKTPTTQAIEVKSTGADKPATDAVKPAKADCPPKGEKKTVTAAATTTASGQKVLSDAGPVALYSSTEQAAINKRTAALAKPAASAAVSGAKVVVQNPAKLLECSRFIAELGTTISVSCSE